jgi:hypothetical protein
MKGKVAFGTSEPRDSSMTSDAISTIEAGLDKLEKYIISRNLRGYDPFDGLMSPLFRQPVLRTNKLLRRIAQQLIKRSPCNIRPVLGIREGYNAVTIGLVLQAMTYLREAHCERGVFYATQTELLLQELRRLQSTGYSGVCWGYDFDWEGRYATIPAHAPTVVATGIITNALFTHYRMTGNLKAFELCQSAGAFVIHDLNRTYQKGGYCFSYSPLDRQIVFNGTMKGARLLTQIYSVTRDERLIVTASETVRFVMKNQASDGSWSYSKEDGRTWHDNFHTGYILDCLDEYVKLSGNNEFSKNLESGLQFYLNNFFVNGEIPKYYSSNTFPIDATAAAQSILTLVRFGHTDKATKVASWVLANMQADAGHIYYQKHRYYTNKTSYMRWSNAWMFLALAFLLLNLRKESSSTGTGGCRSEGYLSEEP